MVAFQGSLSPRTGGRMTDRVGADVPLKSLILVPAIITLAVTLFRLAGELQRWSPTFFNREPGGPGAIVGIVWLVPIFGIYFALKLLRMGHAPARPGVALLVALVSFVVLPITIATARGINKGPIATIALFAIGSVIAASIAWKAWSTLSRVLFAYALAARIPVAIVMLLAILGNWGTHYELGPPGLPEMGPVVKWFWIGLVPQLTFWIAFTLSVGSLFGSLTALALRRRMVPAAA
jgi:hypothetical protein